MTFSFRHRIELPRGSQIDLAEHELLLSQAEGTRVVLSSGSSDVSLREAERFLLRGEGFDTVEQAREAGAYWRSVLERVFARVHISADFGERSLRGGLTSAGISMMEQAGGGARVLNDEHGLMIYESDPQPLFARLEASVRRLASPECVRAALEGAIAQHPSTLRESLAFDLYSASFAVKGIADARFMLLMMALEMLIEQGQHDDTSQRLVDELIAQTQGAELPQKQRESILGALRELRRESIGQAGRRLAARLGDRVYADLAPVSFFNRCYVVRSRLVHGDIPRPQREEVDALAATLEGFVADLIAFGLSTW